MEAVDRYARNGNPLHVRLAHIKALPGAAAASHADSVALVLSLLPELAGDPEEEVRAAAVATVVQLARLWSGRVPGHYRKVPGYREARAKLLPISLGALHDPHSIIQQLGEDVTVGLATIVGTATLDAALLPHIELMSMPPADSDSRESAARLVTGIITQSRKLNKDWCQRALVPLLTEYASDVGYAVRMEAVKGLVKALPYCTGEYFSMSLDSLEKLFVDKIWSVRCECARQMPTIATVLPLDIVIRIIPSLYTMYLNDTSRWVKEEAMLAAGPLLAALPPELVDILPSLPHDFAKAACSRGPLAAGCAACLPTALASLGRDNGRWKELLPAIDALAQSQYAEVRAALADNLPEIANAVSAEAAAEFLPRILDMLNKNAEPEVADALAKGLQSLFAALPMAKRPPHLKAFVEMSGLPQSDTDKAVEDHPPGHATAACGHWRGRALTAGSLASMAELLSEQDAHDVLLPAAITMCNDPVASVRIAAVKDLGRMAYRGIMRDEIIREMLLLTRAPSYKKRQSFIVFADTVLSADETTDMDTLNLSVVNGVVELARDRVPNVRLMSANLLKHLIERAQSEGTPASVVTDALKELQNDTDRGVREAAQAALYIPHFDI